MNQTEIIKKERTWAMFAHLSSFLGWVGIPFANIIAPLIIWQFKKDEMPFCSGQAKECLNFQISMTIYSLISFVLSFIIIGFFALIALLIMNVILTTIAAVKSNNGEAYKYPLTIRLIK